VRWRSRSVPLLWHGYGGMSTFDGPALERDLDDPRLTTQLALVYRALRGGGWWTLAELAYYSGGSEAGVSARIRDLRKWSFGGHTIAKRRRYGGTWEYQMTGGKCETTRRSG
jgi:hypothetical protein